MIKSITIDVDVETFAFGNTKSIRAMTPNGPGEEISPKSYLRFIQLYVSKMGGVVDQADLEAEIEKHFGGIWGPDDLRLIRSVGGIRPKWKNSLDWAKVMARKEDPPILSRTQRRKSSTLRILVQIDADTDPEWLEWVMKRKPKSNFKKRCRGCKRWLPSSAPVCLVCGEEFPASAKKHKLPRKKNKAS